MKVRIRHRTVYEYDTPALLGPHVVRLRPADHARTALLSYNLAVAPEGAEVRWKHNPWGAKEARVSFPAERPVGVLAFTVDAAFDVNPVNPFDFFVDDDAKEVPFAYAPEVEKELAPFLGVEADATLDAFVEGVPFEGDTVSYLVAMNQAVARRIQYVIRMDPGVWTPSETLTNGRGSCRDSALLLVAAFRRRGLAARFVSGYLVQLADEGNIPDLAKGVASDVVDLHAWCEVYVPGGGWIGLDGTSGLLTGEGHIPLAFASDPALAAPVTGTSSEAATRFGFEMTIERLGHEPRPRRPYEDSTWQEVLSAGAAVDRALADEGLRLTCGGEPTWTSREAPHLPEWKTEALGESKRLAGLRFAEELRRRFGDGSVVLQRMGKQYPGESLPRWAIDILWRVDGTPIWRDPSRLALGPLKHVGAAQRAPGPTDAERFGEALAALLDVPSALVPGYEDPWHFLELEARLPPDVDPHALDLDDEEDRRRLARVLERGLGEPVGYALPLGREAGRWLGDAWTFRRERLYLVPGDSPMGLRLPLGELATGGWTPWYADATLVDADDALAFDPESWVQQRRARARAPEQRYAPQGVRTALCVEPRQDVLHVFLPPMPTSEDFLELVAAVEEASARTGQPVRLEGYLPPPDPRLRACTVTPDPGVLEVNVPVASSFAEYVELLELLTDAANHAGLCTEKYQLDGREVGSGGGNHLTLGGPSTIESPWIARPRLLGGMLRYVQHHPSLSYLFTGLFIGPTSQAPRIDEARQDALHELELALRQLPADGDWTPPWLVDRLLRNLLVDVAGNTHRTEICIDKLYDPHGVTGRLGLLEFRAFEMPPHERMAAVQMLLLRAITARLARAPYERPLIPWGTALHDRFMLPHYLFEDAGEVARDLGAHGVPFEQEWLRPFLDLRFPIAGTHVIDGVELELRLAGEPWYTLGEQPAGAVVARYVDSSLERLQVRVSGLPSGDRFAVTVNGVRLPLAPTGRVGEHVAGVRFRAWQPPFCLQPTIGVHHPLRFDLVDTWGRRSLGACSYHVWHPEGRAYDEPPLTAFEAKARRSQRFTTAGHAPYPAPVREVAPRPEHPLTLDLRWC